ncbi:hypothetical protein FACS189459_3160 [Bacilli bacterium]|nr:hypothetical protein FACS189459_3160 [Bacilli bacterium]
MQYAHARICQLLKKYTISIKKTKFDLLTLPIECQLISTMMNYKTIIEKCANSYQVHLLNNYLIELSKLFHSYYANNTIIDTANELNTKQRMLLCIGIKNIIASGLKLLGITPAEEMAKQIKE